MRCGFREAAHSVHFLSVPFAGRCRGGRLFVRLPCLPVSSAQSRTELQQEDGVCLGSGMDSTQHNTAQQRDADPGGPNRRRPV